MHAGKKMVLLVRTDVHGVVEKILADPAIVEQRIALRGGAIAHDGLTPSF